MVLQKKNEIKKSSIRTMSYIVISFFVMIIGVVFQNLDMRLMAIVILFLSLVIYMYRKMEGRVFLGFLLCYFVYLMGQFLVRFIFGKNWHSFFPDYVYEKICMCLYLGLLFSFIGFVLARKFSRVKPVYLERNMWVAYVQNTKKIQTLAKLFFYVAISCSMLVSLEQAVYSVMNGYVSLYTTFNSSLPFFVFKIAITSEFIFCIYLATLPTKKNLRIPLALFLLDGVIVLVSGVRGDIVNKIIFILLYVSYREGVSTSQKENATWISKNMKILMMLLIPFVIFFLSLFNQLRNGAINEYSGFADELIKFFDNQGGSVNVIGYTEIFKDKLPLTNQSYLFGPIINWVKYGFPGRLFTGEHIMKNNTVEMALYGNNLGATISYFANPAGWVSGLGLGTEYLAEAYADFGYWGIIFFNLFLGYMIYRSNFIVSKNWIVNSFFMSIIMSILRMPRNFAFTFFPSFVSILNWIIIIMLLFLSQSSIIRFRHRK